MSQLLTGRYGIMLYVPDLEQASGWYCRNLGFTFGPHDLNHFVELHINGQHVLHLFQSDDYTPLSQPIISLQTGDIDTAYRTLRDNGVEIVTDIVRRSDHASFIFRDLAGNAISMDQFF